MNTFRIVEDSARRAACLTAIVHDGTLIDATVTWFVKSPEAPIVLIHGGKLGGWVVYSDVAMDAEPVGDDDDIDYRVLQALVEQAVRRYLREHRPQASVRGRSVWERLRERWLTAAP